MENMLKIEFTSLYNKGVNELYGILRTICYIKNDFLHHEPLVPCLKNGYIEHYKSAHEFVVKRGLTWHFNIFVSQDDELGFDIPRDLTMPFLVDGVAKYILKSLGLNSGRVEPENSNFKG